MMEGGVHIGRWISKAFYVAILILMSMFVLTLSTTQTSGELQCPDGDYRSTNNVCCNKCLAGFKMVEECHAPGQRTNCIPCPTGQYSDNINFSHTCRGCRQCKKHNVVVSKCQRDRDTICRCEDGYYKSQIDSQAYFCNKCSLCGANERIKEACTPEKNTVCECKPMYYRVNKQCEPCKTCTAECEHLCQFLPIHTERDPDCKKCLHNVIGVAAVALVLLVLVAVITHLMTKWSIKKKLLKSASQTFDVSSDSCEKVQIHEELSDNASNEAAPLTICEYEQLPILPDCVPLEIKISDLIYMVLDQVPVMQVKQLVRLLGVKDTEIEQAELDHRSCREAHYQMLKLWAERGSRAGGLLHLHLLQELVVELRKMHLEKAAEELETNFGFQ